MKNTVYYAIIVVMINIKDTPTDNKPYSVIYDVREVGVNNEVVFKTEIQSFELSTEGFDFKEEILKDGRFTNIIGVLELV